MNQSAPQDPSGCLTQVCTLLGFRQNMGAMGEVGVIQVGKVSFVQGVVCHRDC